MTIPELKEALLFEKAKGSKNIKISWGNNLEESNVFDIDDILERIENYGLEL